ncbi:NMUR1 [Mytilus coruscus]|uniref:NMUR1 n=1 Tax=Mytilus coruscus TaxID=42192 RepID=A0A6J8CDP5_MYTCO|nr:NMUR1 [Mytilus coruscus]
MLNYLLPCNNLQANNQTGFNFPKIDKLGQEMSNYILVIFPYINTCIGIDMTTLSITELVLCLKRLPQEAYAVVESYPWRFGEPFCLFKSCLFEMTAYASVLTITAFTVERYIAICYPLKAQKFASLSRTIKIVITIWIFAFFCALPYPIHTRTFYYLPDYNGDPVLDSLQCNIPHQWVPRMKIVFQLSTILFFAFPMSMITVLYIMIALALRKTTLNRSGSDDAKGSQLTSINAVLRMLVAVVVAFFVCWAPFHAQRLMTVYVTDWSSPINQTIQRYLFYISGVLFFVGSTVNPMLYNVMSVRYRQAFRETLCCCLHGGSRNNRAAYAYNYIKPTKRRLSKDVVMCCRNGINKRSFDEEDANYTSPIGNGNLKKTVCPSCNGGSGNNLGITDGQNIQNYYPQEKLWNSKCADTNI